MKNALIATLSVLVLLLGGLVLWQGAVKQAEEARGKLTQAQQHTAELEKEIAERKLFWLQVYVQLTSGGELRQVRASILDGNPPVVIKGRNGKIMRFNSDGKSMIPE